MGTYDFVGLAFAFAAVPLLLIGYLLRFRGRTDLLRGFARGQILDPARAARWIGTVVLAMGGADLLLGLLWPLAADARWVGYAFLLVNAVGAVVLVVGGDRYRKHPRLWK